MTETIKSPPPPYLRRSPTYDPASSEDRIEERFTFYLYVLRKRKKILIFAVFLCLMIGLVVNFKQKPVYQSSVEIILEPKFADNSGSGGNISTFWMQDPTIFMTQIRMVKGPLMAERVLKKLEASENHESLLNAFGMRFKGKNVGALDEKQQKTLTSLLRNAISAAPVERGARILGISVRGYEPMMTKRVADVVAQTYIEINYESRINAFKQSFSVISKSLAEIREKIKTGEIVAKKVDSEIQLLEALKIYGERHPLVVDLRRSIPELTRQLSQGMKNLQLMEVGQRQDLFQLLLQAHLELPELISIEADLRILKPILEQELSTNREMYNSIFKKLQEIELAEGKNVWIDASMIEAAAVPSRPIRPNKKMNLLLSLVMGLFLGTGMAYFLEYLDSSLKSLEDVKKYLRLFPLGIIPYLDIDAEVSESKQPLIEDAVISHRPFWHLMDAGIPLYIAEAYRIIRTNLAFGAADTPFKVIQVTSAVKGEGKTTTAVNLGISLAEAGFKTLLVDADMRRPSLHRILGLEGVEEGLSNALSQGKPWQETVKSTGMPNLHCLSAGVIPPNPAELLSSKRLQILIDSMRENYDRVIFDSPPVIHIADASILTSCMDGTILVARSNFIPRHFTLQAKNTLEWVNGKIIGCILNSVEAEGHPYYYHYGYKASYDGREDRNPKKQKHSWKRSSLRDVEILKVLKDIFPAFLLSNIRQLIHLLKGEGKTLKKKQSPDVSA